MKKIIPLILTIALCLSLCACGKADDYEAAVALMDGGNYEKAIEAFLELGNYEDSTQKLEECENILSYTEAVALLSVEQYKEAFAIFSELGDYGDSIEKVAECEKAIAYESAISLLNAGDYGQAYTVLRDLGDYKDVSELLTHFVEAEITPENWSEYFSITIVPEYMKNDFNEITYLDLNYTLDIKDEIANRIFDEKNSNVIFEFNYTSIRKDLQFDIVSGEYQILNPVYMMDITMDYTEVLKWEAQGSVKPIIEEAACWIAPPAEAGQPVDGYQYMALAEEFNAIRTQGSIFIYE